MSRDSIDNLELDESEVEEIDLSEGAMYQRAFKKFYFQQKKGKNLMEDEENDCQDIEEDEIDEDELELEDKDIEIEEEDLQ